MFRKFQAVLLAGTVVLVAACGDDTTSSPATDPAPAAPQAIISLSPTGTELLFALGAGEQVLAVDNFSNYPPDAAALQQGIDAYQPNVEAIAALEPDLVVTEGSNPDLLTQLDQLDIAHFDGIAPATFDDLYSQIEQLGAAVGRTAEAAELVLAIETGIAAATADLPPLGEPLTYYHELDPTFFSVTSDSFIGAVYDLFGLVNIADAAGTDTAYPQLSAEYIIDADPDLIFLACANYCGETPATVAARPGWDTIAAVRNGGVIALDDDIASRWSPRIVEFVEQVSAAVQAQAALQPAG